MKFKDKNQEASAKEILQNGAKTEFWKLIVQALEESKQFIQAEMDGDDMQSLPAEQYKLMNEVAKAKKRYLDTLMKTPENIASWLGTPSNERKNFDPYGDE